MKYVLTIVNYLVRFFYFILALLVLIFVVFLFGHPFLGPLLPGSDNANFVVLSSWLYKWLPHIPFWYPQEGGGVSFTVSYPILNHLIVAGIAKLFSINIVAVFRYYGLISIILTSLGIYFLAIRFTKNQTIGFLAAVFYTLSPIAWIFLLEWGFFAEHASYWLIPPSLIFFDLFVEYFFQYGNVFKTRLFGILFVLCSVFVLLAHPLSFIGLILIVVPYAFCVWIFVYQRKNARQFFLAVGALFMAFALLALFWLIPYAKYQKNVAQGAATGASDSPRALLLQNAIYPISFFTLSTHYAGYKDLSSPIQQYSGYAWRDVSFPFAISLLSLIGLVGSFFLSKKVFALGVANLLSLALGLLPSIAAFLFTIPVINNFANWRSLLIPSRFILPLLAGFGAYTIAFLLVGWIREFGKKSPYLVKAIGNIFFGACVMGVACIVLFLFKNYPNHPTYLLSYGTDTIAQSRMTDTRSLFHTAVDTCGARGTIPDSQLEHSCQNTLLQAYFWVIPLQTACQQVKGVSVPQDIASLCSNNPTPNAINSVIHTCQTDSTDVYQPFCRAQADRLTKQLQEINKSSLFALVTGWQDIAKEGNVLFYSAIPHVENTRIDMGGVGGFMMAEPFYSAVPELGVYFNQSSLIPLLWNYEIASYYSAGTWPEPQILSELAQYMGISYTFVPENKELLAKYTNPEWEVTKVIDTGAGKTRLFHAKKDGSLVSASTKPVVLVIGQHKQEVYFRYFHLANIGVLPYGNAILVDGGEHVESYSLQELSQFDAIIMDGYVYQDKQKAWNLLDTYLKNGGSLYINTGWQYTSADWQTDTTPNFFPLNVLRWTAPQSQNVGVDKAFAKGVSAQAFSPLRVGSEPWNISTGTSDEMRDFAKPILTSDKQILAAAGQYGNGRVVWTGLDLAGHIGTYQDNPAEVTFVKNIFSYLLPSKIGKDIPVIVNRTYPDRVTFTFEKDSLEKTVLYWKEAFHPDFQAILIHNGQEKQIPIYNTGAGMVGFILPTVSRGDSIMYQHVDPLAVQAARAVSLMSLILLLIFVFNPHLFSKHTQLVKKHIAGVHKKVKSSLAANEEDY